MARRSKIERELEQLTALRDDPNNPQSRDRLRAALAHKSNLVVASAAHIIGEIGEAGGFSGAEIGDLSPLMTSAFDRFMTDPVKRDPQCRAKIALVRALGQLDCDAEDAYRRALRHTQDEPGWGGESDTAGQLRALAAIALVNGRYPDIWPPLAELLADPEPNARSGAAQAMACSGNSEIAVPLLRLRIRCGEENSQVLVTFLGALLSLSPDTEIEYVASLLSDRTSDRREAACLALGESRLAGALAPLCTHAENCVSAAERRIAFVAIAMLRTDDAWAHLLDRLARGSSAMAGDALSALAAYHHDKQLGQRVLAACSQRGDDRLIAEATRTFSAR
ncbi:MAG: hypothetical protein MJE77_28855 [Proteobacteria bacterium]|nr:hypothetical protein [Pseudomonadota bacterium]